MNLSISLLGLFALSALFLGLVVVLIGVVMGWRDFIRQSSAMRQNLIAEMTPLFAAQTRRVEELLAAHHGQRQTEDAALRQDILAIRADVEWLSGERMIEQALTMFHDGKSDGDVSQELGLPLETVRTLNLLRAH